MSEADKIVEGARKSMANAEISDGTTGLNEKLKEDILLQASDEEPGPELASSDDQNEVSNPGVQNKTNTKAEEGKS